MKKGIIAFVAVLILGTFTIHLAFTKENNPKPVEAMEQTILRLLFDPTYEAIRDYYGEPRQYWKDKLVSDRQISGTSYDEVILQVETFCGPHNPPYGIETMTFHIGYGEVTLVNFEHQDESN